MKLQIISDLHLEMDNAVELEQTDADVILLAGDIAIGVDGMQWAGAQAQRLGKPIVYVAGNHEFFEGDRAVVVQQLRECAEQQQIHYLEQQVLVVGSVRFLGCTLWFSGEGTSSKRGRKQLAQRLNDFAVIADAGRTLDLDQAAQLHHAAVDWLDARLQEEFAGPTVVLTHHAPSPRSWPWRWTRWGGVTPNWARPAYCTDLGWLMQQYKPALWVHGHIHAAADYEIGQTRVLCNPYGASEGEAVGFDPAKIVEI